MGSMNPQVKNCNIRLANIGTEGYELAPTKTPLTKEQKHLLLPVKKSAKQNKADTKTPKREKKSKDGKFQMKISAFLSPPTKKIKLEEDAAPPAKIKLEEDAPLNKKIKLDEEAGEEDRASPDSGVGSRAISPTDSSDTSRSETPAERLDDSGVATPVKEDDKEDEEEDEKEEVDEDVEEAVEKEKSKFKEELSDEELSSSSSEEEESEDDWDDDDDNAFSKKKKTAVSRKPAAKGKGKFLAPVVIPGAMKSELALSDYEKIRNDNIKEREDMLARLMADFDQYKQDNGMGSKPAPKKRKKMDKDGSFQSGAHVPLTRRKSSRLTDQEKKDTFGSIEWMTPEGERRKLAEEDSDYEEDDEDRPQKKKREMPSRWAVDPNVDILMPEDVTPGMLKRISFMGSGKKYDTVRGTSCHQCRQKTIDQKTICRSGECSGVRGQFCGACLRNRYGEDASEALMNPSWKCPPCLGICNCSICRNRSGKGATGILIHLAQSKGFDNVSAYLLSLQKKKGTDEFDE